MPEARCQRQDARGQRPDARCQMPVGENHEKPRYGGSVENYRKLFPPSVLLWKFDGHKQSEMFQKSTLWSLQSTHAFLSLKMCDVVAYQDHLKDHVFYPKFFKIHIIGAQRNFNILCVRKSANKNEVD